jgi:hypothetical protein
VDYLLRLQDNAFITWVRESESLLGYTLYLAFHTIGMVFLVGPNLLIAARVLGLAPGLPIKPMRPLGRIMDVGLWITVITGSVLFATAPVGYVHNIVFIVKIAAIVLALAFLRAALRQLFDPSIDPDAHPVPAKTKRLMAATLVMWLIAVVAGRLTAYSGVVVLASLSAFLIVLAVATAVACMARLWTHRRRPIPSIDQRATFRIDIQPATVKGGK